MVPFLSVIYIAYNSVHQKDLFCNRAVINFSHSNTCHTKTLVRGRLMYMLAHIFGFKIRSEIYLWLYLCKRGDLYVCSEENILHMWVR